MSKTGCFICNYNKKEYVVECVRSLLEQTYNHFDIYVIDNASGDGSVMQLKESFGESITIIENEINLGGSGGFNCGLRTAIEKKYDYAVLLDNDVRADKEAIGTMLSYMEEHRDVGMLGAKVLQMSHPDLVQDMGGSVSETYNMSGNYLNMRDKGLPDLVYSDYISTCAAMIRVSVLEHAGIMPEENFIYWDDVELSKKIQLAGFQTVAYGKAIVWHNMSTADESSFNKYYLYRNKLKFFSAYLRKQELDGFKEIAFRDLYSKYFMYRYRGYRELALTITNALEDFIQQKWGRAADGRIITQDAPENPVRHLLEGRRRVGVIADLRNADHKSIIQKLRTYADASAEFIVGERELPGDADVIVKACSHIKSIKDNILPVVWVDQYMHCIDSDQKYNEILSFEYGYEIFRNQYWDDYCNTIECIHAGAGIMNKTI